MNGDRLVRSLAWLAFLALIVVADAQRDEALRYVATWQRWVLYPTCAGLALMVAIDAWSGRRGAAARDAAADGDGSWAHTAVHLIPVFLLAFTGTASLGSHGAKVDLHLAREIAARAAVGASADARPRPSRPELAPLGIADAGAPAAPPPAGAAGSIPGDPDAAPMEPFATPTPMSSVTPPARPSALLPPAVPETVVAYTPIDVLELNFPQRYPGVRRVATVAMMISPKPEVMQQLLAAEPIDATVLIAYRYLMICCAADSQPTFLMLRSGQHTLTAADRLPDDTWVRIFGTWIHPPGLGRLPTIEVDAIERVDAPADPFLQPIFE